MPIKVEECVRKLMKDPKFNPQLRGGKTKEETAWAICQSSVGKDKQCLCEIESDELFMEALEEILKNDGVHKSTEEFVEQITAELTLDKEALTDEELVKINKLTLKPVKKEDIVTYPAMLITDQITRNNTQYTKEFQKTLLSLPVGEGNFIGSPVLFGNGQDHQETASAQVGRIYDAYQVIDKEKHTGVLGKMYILKEGHEDLISKIDAGVLKEVSIAAKVEFPMCSICKQNIQTCEHERGKDGCYAIMSGKGFCGEVSFVAVPGSGQAKILKDTDLNNYVKLEANIELLKEFIKTEIHSSLDPIKTELVSLKENITAKDPKGTMAADKPGVSSTPAKVDVVAHNVNLFETYNEIVEKIDKAKELTIRYTARFNLPLPKFSREVLPKIEQGMRSVDEQFISKTCYMDIEALDKAVGSIEEVLNYGAVTGGTFTGDVANTVLVVKYMSKKIEIILERLYRLQGRFHLEDIEKDNLINETVRLGTIIDKIEIKDKEVAKKFFQNLSTNEVARIKDMFFKEGSAIFKEEKPTIIEPAQKNKKEDMPKDAKEMAKKILNKEDK